MSFKKSAFGGYNKKAVDEAVEKLNEEVARLEASEKELQRRLEQSDVRMTELEQIYRKASELDTEHNAELEQRNREQQDEIDRLNRMIEDMRTENTRLTKDNHALASRADSADKQYYELMSSSISKIYMRAYNSGHEIAVESENMVLAFLDEAQRMFQVAEEQANDAITEYENTGNELKGLISHVNECLRKVETETEQLLEKAHAVSGILGQMNLVKEQVCASSEAIINEYEQNASEFLMKEWGAEPEDKKEGKAEAEKVIGLTEVLETEPEELKEIMEDQTEPEELKGIMEDRTEPEELKETMENQTEPEELKQNMENSKAPEVLPVDTIGEENKNNSFTQFGTKSKISSEERQELIRKAMLKYSGS